MIARKIHLFTECQRRIDLWCDIGLALCGNKILVRAVKAFFYFSIIYLGFALIVASIYMDGNMTGLAAISISARTLLSVGKYFLIGIMAGVVVLVLVVDRKILQQRALLIAYALVATVLTQAGFTLLKNAMSFITPYFADPFFANVDQALHFGVDPWVIAHWLGQYLPTKIMTYSYLTVWGLPAMALPAIIAASDGNRARVTRTLVIYLVAWVFIGNVLAFSGLSAGPVYYDRLLGVDRFADLTMALQTSGVSDSHIGRVQRALWDIYAGHSASIGSGISAFPSVHVAIATVTAIYLVERSKWLLPLAAAFLFFTFFLSVYTGYHYAVDGYVSILVVFAVWWGMRRKFAPE